MTLQATKPFVDKPHTRLAMGLYLILYPIIEGISNQYLPIGTVALGLIVALVWLAELVNSRSLVFSYGHILLSLFTFWNITSYFWSLDKDRTLERSISLFLVMVIYWVVTDIVHKKDDFARLCYSYSLGALILALTGVYNIIAGNSYNDLSNRYSGIGYDPNNFGIFILSAVPIFDQAIREFRKPSPILSWVFLAFMTIVALSTGSRSALIAAGIINLYMIVSNVSLKRNALRSVTALTTFALLLGVTWRAQSTFIPVEALTRASSELAVSGEDERSLIWREAFSMWLDDWLIGVGSNAFYSVSDVGFQIHNTFISALAELGIVGFLIWASLWLAHIALIVRCGRANRVLAFGLTCAFGCVLIGALTLNWEARKPLYLVWGLIGAAGAISKRRVLRQSVERIEENFVAIGTRL